MKEPSLELCHTVTINFEPRANFFLGDGHATQQLQWWRVEKFFDELVRGGAVLRFIAVLSWVFLDAYRGQIGD